MFKYIVTAICILAGLDFAQGQSCTDQAPPHPPFKWAGTQPLVLLTEFNPWAMAIGSDSPTFALYSDGTVIYWKGENRSGKYVSAKLTPSEIAESSKSVHLDDAKDFKSCYSIADFTDAPTNYLVLQTTDGYKTVDVYGSIRPIGQIPPDRLPTNLQEAFRAILGFDTPKAHDWTPTYIEVILWPFSYAKSSAPWPPDFPGVSDEHTRRTKHGFELFIPYSDFDRYKTFVSKLKPTTAVLLDGQKWAISQRLPFPHEGKP